MLALMDATQAIADLTEISPQVTDVVVIAADGALTGSNLPTDEAARRLADGARGSWTPPRRSAQGSLSWRLRPPRGSVFVVRDGQRLIAARTTPEPTVGLVFYDLKTCLRSVGDAEPSRPRRKAAKPKRRAKPRRKRRCHPVSS